jgi:hypothetical protein
VEASASARLHSSFGPRRAIRFIGYREALENYAYVDNGFKLVGQLGHVAKEANDGDAWLNAIDPARTIRRLINTDPKTNKRVPAPDRNATSVIPSRAPKTTLIDSTTGGLRNGKTTRVGDDRMTKRL